MAPTQFPTTQPTSNQLETQVIVLICVSAYILIFAIVIIIRQCIVPLERVCIFLNCIFCCKRPDESRGFCTECTIFGKALDRNDCCDCCIGLSQACNCSVPGSNICCDRLCGPRRRCDLADCLTCGICGQDPKICGGIECACACQSPDCDHVNCICFEIQLR